MLEPTHENLTVNEPLIVDPAPTLDLAVQPSAPETLDKKDWPAMFKEALELAELRHAMQERLPKIAGEVWTLQNKVVQLERALGDKLDDLRKLQHLNEKLQVDPSGETVPLSELSNLILKLDEVKESDEDRLTVWAIYQKCRFPAAETDTTSSGLSTEEVAFLKRTMPMLITKWETEILEEITNIETQRIEVPDPDHLRQKVEQQIEETTNQLKELVTMLDQKELEMGAPEYKDISEGVDAVSTSYLARIAWRKQVAGFDKRLSWYKGSEFKRKLALLTNIDEKWVLLNPKHAYDDIHLIDLLLHRVPGTTIGVSAEQLEFESAKYVRVGGIIENGVGRLPEKEEQEHLETELGSPEPLLQSLYQQGGLR